MRPAPVVHTASVASVVGAESSARVRIGPISLPNAGKPPPSNRRHGFAALNADSGVICTATGRTRRGMTFASAARRSRSGLAALDGGSGGIAAATYLTGRAIVTVGDR